MCRHAKTNLFTYIRVDFTYFEIIVNLSVDVEYLCLIQDFYLVFY
jgi:hypothetical protein